MRLSEAGADEVAVVAAVAVLADGGRGDDEEDSLNDPSSNDVSTTGLGLGGNGEELRRVGLTSTPRLDICEGRWSSPAGRRA